MDKITAFRNGQERQFTARQWDAMGIGHCGWEQTPSIPKEVAQAAPKLVWVNPEIPIDPPPEPQKRTRKQKTK